jgi:hypothetical protein
MSARSTDKSSIMVSVFDGRDCIGFVISRGKAGCEPFNADQKSIGLFSSEADAVAALWRLARSQFADQEGAP